MNETTQPAWGLQSRKWIAFASRESRVDREKSRNAEPKDHLMLAVVDVCVLCVPQKFSGTSSPEFSVRNGFVNNKTKTLFSLYLLLFCDSNNETETSARNAWNSRIRDPDSTSASHCHTVHFIFLVIIHLCFQQSCNRSKVLDSAC